MKKIYKWLLFALFLGFLGFISIYFIPSAKREVLSKKQPDNMANIASSENTPGTDDKNIENSQRQDIISQNTIPEKYEKKTIEVDKGPENEIKIIQKLVSWGFSKSSEARKIDTIIIHSSYNALDGDEYDVNKLIREYKSYGVSPHYLIDRNGNIYQLVKDQDIAYHAGESKMPDGRINVNNFSLGIEIMTTEKDKPAGIQYQALINLIAHIKKSYPIKNILGHNQIASGRKNDPWNFDWEKISSVK